jgi:lysozyme
MSVGARVKLVAWIGAAGAAAAIAFTTQGEAEVDGVYPDPADPHILTACIGETAYVTTPGDIRKGAKFTHVECVDALYRRFAQYAGEIQRCGGDGLTEGQKIAFLDFRHNVGRFCGTTLAKKAAASDVRGSCDAIYLYRYVGKVDCFAPENANALNGTCRGIRDRRNKQHAKCMEASDAS